MSSPPSPTSLPLLPIDSLLPQIRAALDAQSNLILTAPPGAGKSTRVPAALLGEAWLADGKKNLEIVMLQPRRVAARAVAARIAAERGTPLGEEIGYQIRFENRTSRATRLRVVTEGILARRLAGDPFLEGVGCVILDEFHERSLHTDLALALLREVQRTVRPELRLLIMSATLDAQPISAFLADAPIITSPGRLFPVAIEFAPRHDPCPIPEQCAAAIKHTLTASSDSGHILVFLPGIGEIRKTETLIASAATRAGCELHFLHSSIPAPAQDAALRPGLRRKLILATNIAETSLTIDGVTTVIDSGVARIALQDARLGIDRLELRRISQASAAQRAGRAGRTAPGKCVRLWTHAEDATLQPHETPEIERVDLTAALLLVKQFGYTNAAAFQWFEPPRPDALQRAENLLHWLGATTEDGTLTPLGRNLTPLPVAPRLGALLLAGINAGLADEAIRIAAVLHDGESLLSFSRNAESRRDEWGGQSDLLDDLRSFEQAAPHLARARDQLQRALAQQLKHTAANKHTTQRDPEALRKLLLHAYPDRVTRRREGNAARRGIMAGGRGIELDRASAVWRAPFFLSLDPRDPPPQAANQAEARVTLASAIEPQWLAEIFPHLMRREAAPQWDATRQRVMALRRTLYLDLVIEQHEAAADPRDPATAQALYDALLGDEEAIIAAQPAAAEWLARVRLLARHMPELHLPELDHEALAAAFAAACQGKSSRTELEAHDWRADLDGHLTYPQRAALAREAPEALRVPSGSNIRLSYTAGDHPILAARLQELFGWAETPRLAAGRVAVVLHLLGPNHRPVQVTRDLKNFWNTTYKEVRKDLRARYPKHPWPEDPWNAPAIAVGRRRKPTQ